MFVTGGEIYELVGHNVPQSVIIQAQNIIEAFVGRDEIDVTDPRDRSLLAKATAYQAVYIEENPARVFEQAAITQIAQFGQSISIRQDGASPWIAPLAIIACQKLSWRRMRSIKTGSTFHTGPVESGWATE